MIVRMFRTWRVLAPLFVVASALVPTSCSREDDPAAFPAISMCPLQVEAIGDVEFEPVAAEAFDFAGGDAQGWTWPEGSAVSIQGDALVFAPCETRTDVSRIMSLMVGDASEMRLHVRGSAQVRVDWTNVRREESWDARVELDVDGDQHVTIPLRGHEAWIGMLRHMVIRVFEHSEPVVIDDIQFVLVSDEARLTEQYETGELQFLGDEGRRGRLLTGERTLVTRLGPVQEGGVISFAVGAPPVTADRGMKMVRVRLTGAVDYVQTIPRSLGWTPIAFRVDDEIEAAESELRIDIEGSSSDALLVTDLLVKQETAAETKSVILITAEGVRPNALAASARLPCSATVRKQRSISSLIAIFTCPELTAALLDQSLSGPFRINLTGADTCGPGGDESGRDAAKAGPGTREDPKKRWIDGETLLTISRARKMRPFDRERSPNRELNYGE